MSGYVGDGLIIPYRGMFGDMTVIPDCVIEEHGSDRLQITEHPVETSAAITDHAFKLPAEVVLRYSWSNSVGGDETYSRQMYEALLSMQVSMSPFTLVTGKRAYPNMLIAGVDQTTDARYEYGLETTVTCRQIILVSTTTTSVAPAPSPAAAQAPTTQSPTNQGTQTPKPAPNSLANQMAPNSVRNYLQNII